MPFTAATSQVLVESARQAIIKTELAIESYLLTNNPGLLAALNTQLDACEAAIAALQA